MEKAVAYDAASCGYDTKNGGDWVQGAYTRVHRDQEIINSMRGWMGLSQESDPTKLGLGPHCGQQTEEQFLQK